MILCSIQDRSHSPFLSLEYVLGMFLNFEHFSASRSYEKRFYKWFLIKKRVLDSSDSQEGGTSDQQAKVRAFTARFDCREDIGIVLNSKRKFQDSDRVPDAIIFDDFAGAKQEEGHIPVKAMFKDRK